MVLSNNVSNNTAGVESMDTIFVKYVKEESPAQRAGLNTGDRILSIDDQNVAGKSYSQVVNLIRHRFV